MTEINQGHYLEMMDRLHVVMCMIDEHLLKHPVAEANKDLKFQIEYALGQLGDAYQIAGRLDYNNSSDPK